MIMEDFKTCPICENPYGYLVNENMYNCPECGHEWEEKPDNDNIAIEVKDSNGNVLNNGDSVIVIKDLPVKGSSNPIKAGTKVKKIILTEGNHNISCKIDGFGAMALKSEFVRKA